MILQQETTNLLALWPYDLNGQDNVLKNNKMGVNLLERGNP